MRKCNFTWKCRPSDEDHADLEFERGERLSV
jgi:hypothetical protein